MAQSHTSVWKAEAHLYTCAQCCELPFKSFSAPHRFVWRLCWLLSLRAVFSPFCQFLFPLLNVPPDRSPSPDFSSVSLPLSCALLFRVWQKECKYTCDKSFARSLQLRSQPPEHNMQGVAENDTVNLEGLLSHGAIRHKKCLYCLLMYSVYILLYPTFLCLCWCVCVLLNYWSSVIE